MALFAGDSPSFTCTGSFAICVPLANQRCCSGYTNVPGSISGQPALQVLRDADDRWIQARRIWNQHAYYVTNVIGMV